MRTMLRSRCFFGLNLPGSTWFTSYPVDSPFIEEDKPRMGPYGFVAMTITETCAREQTHSHSSEMSWACQFLALPRPKDCRIAATIKRLHLLMDRLACRRPSQG
jgi:hypothetical protein